MLLFFFYLLFLVLGGLALSALVLGLIYVPHVVRVSLETGWLTAETPEPAWDDGEACSFFTADGLPLSGTYLPTPAPHRMGVVIFCHELTANRWTAAPYVENLRQRGFDVFTFDFRNHGQSAALAGYEPLPWLTYYELDDLRAAINYVCSRDDADARGVGLLGLSRGGTAALCAAAQDSRVQAVATDGAFAFEAVQLHYIRRYMSIFTAYAHLFAKLPDRVLSGLCKWAQWIIGRRRHCRFVNVEQMLRWVRQPVLLIHGGDDPFVPLEVVDALRRCLTSRNRLRVVPGARHNAAIDVARDEYQRHLARFFLKHLAAGRRARARQGAPHSTQLARS